MRLKLIVTMFSCICLNSSIVSAQSGVEVGTKVPACLNAHKISIWLWPTIDRVKGCDPNLVELSSLIMLEAGAANRKMSFVPLPSVMGGTIRGAMTSLQIGKAAASYGLKAAGYTLAWIKYFGSSVVVKATNKIMNKQENYESVRSYLAQRYRSCYNAIRDDLYDGGLRANCVGRSAKRWLPTN